MKPWRTIKQIALFSIALVLNSYPILRAEAKPLKIINWNVLYGFNHNKAISEGSRWIREQHPDVIALQELNGLTEKELGKHAKTWGHDHAVTHKESGFPVGLASTAPIDVIERRIEGFHHGFLHCKTHGIHFFVVHFWPGKFHEVDSILQRTQVLRAKGESVIILGDFNGCSRRDNGFLRTHAPLREIDFTFVDKVEAEGFVDIVAKHDPKAKISCPSPITIPRWTKSLDELQKKQYRIDFVFADSHLSKRSVSGTISLAKELDSISDHYPVIIELHAPMDNHSKNSKNE